MKHEDINKHIGLKELTDNSKFTCFNCGDIGYVWDKTYQGICCQCMNGFIQLEYNMRTGGPLLLDYRDHKATVTQLTDGGVYYHLECKTPRGNEYSFQVEDLSNIMKEFMEQVDRLEDDEEEEKEFKDFMSDEELDHLLKWLESGDPIKDRWDETLLIDKLARNLKRERLKG